MSHYRRRNEINSQEIKKEPVNTNIKDKNNSINSNIIKTNTNNILNTNKNNNNIMNNNNNKSIIKKEESLNNNETKFIICTK